MHNHWAVPYIGLSFDHVADCWGLCRTVWKDRFGLEVADVACDRDDARDVGDAFTTRRGIVSRPVGEPFEGVAVYMTSARLPHHIGIYVDVDGGGVLHAMRTPGVIFTRMRMLGTLGFRVLGYYAPEGLSCPQSIS
jgi:cell wall-associated NlpC family hydrolase